MRVRLVATSCAGRPSRTPVSPNTNRKSGLPPGRWKLRRTPGGASLASPWQRSPELLQSTRASTAPATRARRYPSPDVRQFAAFADAAGEARVPGNVKVPGAPGVAGAGGVAGAAGAAGAAPVSIRAAVRVRAAHRLPFRDIIGIISRMLPDVPRRFL